MTNWFLPYILTDDEERLALEGNILRLPAKGLPDLSRAQGVDHVAQWIRQLYPHTTPEQITVLAQHYWQLGHELMMDDIIIIPIKNRSAYSIGEIGGLYRRDGSNHSWPVRWLAPTVAAESLPALGVYAHATELTEITDEDALKALQPYIPAVGKTNTTLFRWMTIGILVFELIYFWPRGTTN